jgi:hypothetical protein
MRTSTTRFLTGFIAVAALGFGVVVAQADGANGPDAGIGITGYNLDYQYSADGSGPGYQRHPVNPEQYQDSYQKYGPHYHHQW